MNGKGVIEEKFREIRLQHDAREMMVIESQAELESIRREEKLLSDLIVERSELLGSLEFGSTFLNNSSELN